MSDCQFNQPSDIDINSVRDDEGGFRFVKLVQVQRLKGMSESVVWNVIFYNVLWLVDLHNSILM